MISSHEMRFRPTSGLFSIPDPIHNLIDLRDPTSSKEVGTIVRLLDSPMLERLHRIKQLGYALHGYPSAVHSRYAHALGTMHMMRAILNHLDNEGSLQSSLFKDLSICFPNIFSTRKVDGNKGILIRHMLVAALFQDVGELPYNMATELIFKPSDNLKEFVQNSVGFEINDWVNKDIFTIACLHDSRELLSDLNLDLPFLVFLITGHVLNPAWRSLTGLRQLRHMLDGEVDADRLDYVYRDVHQTFGGPGTPTSVVETLLQYDELGPIFSTPGPVSDFLVIRAHLWTNVYFAPVTRFRTLLLIELLRGIKEDEECSRAFLNNSILDGLSLAEFRMVDDISLTANITALYEGKKKNRLKPKAQKALEVLVGKESEYDCFWLPYQDEERPPSKMFLPNDLFFDTYSNYQNHVLYKPGSIRIMSEQFKFLGSLLPLEECCGAFSSVFNGRWSALPMPGNILLFLPKNKQGGAWDQLDKAIENKTLYTTLMENDPLLPRFSSDTRKLKGFTGPSVFISFAWADIDIIEKIITVLNRKRRRYYLLYEPYQGLGADTGSNSVKAVKEAEAVLVLASTNYVARYNGEPDGNIAKEIIEMTKRVSAEQLPVVFLSADDFKQIENKLPYSNLGYKGTPFVGTPLKDASSIVIEDAINEALKKIDEQPVIKGRKKR